ncbi:MAG: STAS domain-containing protein [Planctomycetales bacterium]|nr:STAS domain-containing protein [Planctomycetales bacterium]NIM09854.1 STAS domain-containing protein [Planctomycetales bacterium]NIN09294.1 STAS domain-containing protein [Planctomycetales bacterium]NIN78401.1 STAS domain-containing protein [Planctomycetales bacterium]NIO35579.1 STAS domain-containing protein [Planctomycetales bacterium]
MQLTTETFRDVIVAHAPEEMNHERAEPFVEFVTRLDPRNVVMDLDGTEILDSGGLESLLVAQRRLREDGGELKISTNNSTNRKILEITRLDDVFEVYASVIEAVKSYS